MLPARRWRIMERVSTPEHLHMRIPLAIAVLALLGLSVSTLGAQAQGAATARQQMQARDAKSKPPKADEQAYRDALKQIPVKKADPWGNMR